ncbi:MAG: ABC transporter ATP-binding protein/permease [Oscillospiraceae bacterium]|nr:ABC transporter ATP-binding protein/permease [Oscillospiraceae bacterium]
MAEKKNRQGVLAQLKARLAVDDVDVNDAEIYKHVENGPGPGGGKDFRKPKDTKGTLLRILGYAGKNRGLLVLIVVMMLISTGCSLVASYFLKPLIDDYIVPLITQPEKDFAALAGQLAILACIYLASAVATYFTSRACMQVAQWSTNAMRRDLFAALQDMPITYFDQHTHGELMSRFSNDADNVQMCLEQGIVQFLSGIITFAGTVVLMLALSWRLFIVTAITIALSFGLVRGVGKYSKILFKKQQSSLGILNGYIEEMLDGLKVVKAFNYEERAKDTFGDLNDEYRENAICANFLGNVIMPTMNAVMNICYAVTAVLGGFMTVTGRFTIGSLGVYLNYIRQVTTPINMMSNQAINLFSAIAGAERIFAVIDHEPETDEGKVSLVTVNRAEDGTITETGHGERTGSWAWKIPQEDGSFAYKEVLGNVRLENVSFSYVPEKPVLKDITVWAKPGEKIAFVGSTGAGKTTITNLINRFYEIDRGRILFDGIDVKDIQKSGLRRSLGIVLQDTNLFTGTVMDNIRYGRLDATDEECIQAAKSANAHGFITRLPDGYNTMISGNGQNLSQGQRQLLAIARTAVANHPVMIMDEATSSIDTRTEKLIDKGMDALMEGRTVFVIAHRLSTVRNAHAIVVIEHGDIVERGSHEELLAQEGRYYMLYTGQSELE